MSAALQEALAYADPTVVIHHTLELWHPAFSQPLYLVRDHVALDARIEAGAARNAGDVVTFVACRFDLVPPEQVAATDPVATVEIDNTDRAIGAQVMLAASGGEFATLIYRQYLAGQTDDGPEIDPPLQLEVRTVAITPFRVRATAGFRSLQNRAFPAEVFSLDEFPGLAP